ncbi:MAG: hypothetical protein IPL10_12385 [Bacteroidetes bacterium]|nr:hypothetical protein [Bacteroidota bacterium]
MFWITPEDIKTFIAADSVASQLKDVQSPIEYCKSSPFPFSFMEGYQLQRLTQREIAAGNIEVRKALKNNKRTFLPIEVMDNYGDLMRSNAKLSYLLDETLYNGGSDLLWIPPSLPYYQLDGAFKSKECFSKTLVFSSWVMVPKMIAALTSYECERLTIGDKKAIENAEERSERKYFQTGSDCHPKARLRFRKESDNFSTLSSYALLYPCLTLSELWKPNAKDQNLTELIGEIEEKIKSIINSININEFITEPSKSDDDRWALILMILLDRKNKKEVLSKLRESEDSYNWEWFYKDEETSLANDYYEKVFGEMLFANFPVNLSASMLAMGGKEENPIKNVLLQLKLGKPPADIAKQLAYLTVASPSICACRLLSSLENKSELLYLSFYGAFQIADSFRKFFNVSENIATIDKFRQF